MANGDLTECLKCGAMVDRMSKHRRWHEALENLVPGIEAEAERLGEAQRAAEAYPPKRIR